MRIVLLGPPGAGKGSLAGLIKEMQSIAHVSTGDMLREEMKKGTPLGQEIKGLIDKGALVPDEVVTRLVEQRVKTDPQLVQGYMLDGFPRTVQQARDLDLILKKAGQPLDFALNMETQLATILKRLAGRRVCKKCGALYHVDSKPPKAPGVCDVCRGPLFQRTDDNEETIRKRMAIYRESTQPIVEYYARSGRLKAISGDKETEDVRDELVKILNDAKKPNQDQKPGRS